MIQVYFLSRLGAIALAAPLFLGKNLDLVPIMGLSTGLFLFVSCSVMASFVFGNIGFQSAAALLHWIRYGFCWVTWLAQLHFFL